MKDRGAVEVKLFFNVSHPVVFFKFIQDTNSSQTQQVHVWMGGWMDRWMGGWMI
jgi:hypothetical protein